MRPRPARGHRSGPFRRGAGHAGSVSAAEAFRGLARPAPPRHRTRPPSLAEALPEGFGAAEPRSRRLSVRVPSQVGKMQGNKGFNMDKQNHAPRKQHQHQHQQHPPPSIPANGQQANSQSESRSAWDRG